MGASAISIEWAILGVVLLSVIALLISPFSAIFVLVAGAIVVAFIAFWGKRAASGDVEGDADTPPVQGVQGESEKARLEEEADTTRREQAQGGAI